MMGFWDAICSLAEASSEYMKTKTMDDLCNSINSDDIMSCACSSELCSRLSNMSNRELINMYDEYYSYSSDKLLQIFKNEMNKRGMKITY